MNLRNIGIVYRKELIDSLRDRRTVISMIVVPLLVMPLLTIGMGVLLLSMIGQAQKETPTVMILGGDDSPHVRAELEKLEDVVIVPAKPDFAEEISNKQIRAAVEIPKGFEAKMAAGESSNITIYMYEGELKSSFGADRLQRFFRQLRDNGSIAECTCPSATNAVAGIYKVKPAPVFQFDEVARRAPRLCKRRH